MSESKQIVDAFRQVRRFCREVSLLLTTADGLMQEHGWKSAKGSIVLADLSKSVSEPDWWLPCYFCRFYEHKRFPHLIAFISILVEENEEPNLIDKALISGGVVDYGLGNKRGDWEYWFCQWHLWIDGHRDDGSLNKDDPRTTWGREGPKGVKRVITFGWPLDQIDSTHALKVRVAERLMAAVDEATLER